MSNVNNILNNYDLDKDKDLDKLEKKINNLLEQLEFVDNKNDEEKILNKINEIKELIKDVKYSNSYKYPDYDDNNFIKKIMSKKEFAINKINKEDIEGVNKEFFELSNNQQFLKKFISPNTPYRSIYLYHGVGVGKTCASIQISDNFKKYFSKKILVILPSTLKDNYKKELFNIKKLNKEDDNMEQCLENYYLHQIIGRNKMDADKISKKAKNLINNEYEFLGYQEFVNLVEKIKSNSPSTKIYNTKIREYFDNRVIIVDEIHNMRMIKDAELGKKVPKIFHYVLDKLKNNVLVLLSATPMFNDYKEILFILNTLLINNKEKKLPDNIKIFNDNGEIDKDFNKILMKLSSNFISYMRGENPYSFPIRLTPKINKDKNILKKEFYPKKDMYGKKIEKEDQIDIMELVFTQMSKLQSQIYKSIKSDKNNTNDDDKSIEKADLQQRVQVSNIIYPSKTIFDNDELSETFNVKNTYGMSGLKYVLDGVNDLKLKYKKETIDNYGEIFDYKNINKYSPKIKLLMDYVKNSEGIILVYSRYIYSGIIPIALALEHLGYNKYDNNNLFSDNIEKGKSKGNYVIISGNTKLSPNNTKEINVANLKENSEGEKIKVIIISESGTEGLDLKNVREIHIFEPWYNVNRIEQIVGRGVRNNSHIDLPKSKRNTTIYNYVNLTSKNTRESIDFRMYRISENKQKKISVIEKIMKENSLDCSLNEEALSFKDIKRDIITSQKKKNELKLINSYDISDKNRSRVCDYSECNFKCAEKINWNTINVDESTFNKNILYYDIHIAKKYIINFFKNNNIALLEYLKRKIKLKDDKILFFAINDLVKNKILFKNENNRMGYIIYKSNKYIFQPTDISDEKITVQERKQKRQNRAKKIDITNIEKVTNKFIVPDEMCNIKKEDDDKINLNNILESKYTDIINQTKLDKNSQKKLIQSHDKFIWDIIIDNMGKNELLQLYKNILKNKLDEAINNKVVKSLNRSYLVMKNAKGNVIALYNYFDDVFMCLNENNQLVNCSPISNGKYMDLLNSKISKYSKRNIKSLGYYSTKKNESIYKVKDLDKLELGDKIKGTTCIGTSTITNKKLIKFINKFDNSILKDDVYFSNSSLCMIYQLVLRNLNDKNIIYFLRPSFYNLIKL